MALESMQNHFTGLPMESLIGTPLKAACDSQIMLARSTVDFIRDVGFEGDKTRTADFSFLQNVVTGKDAAGNDIIEHNKVSMEVPVLAIVNIPSLMIDEVDLTFDMEKSSERSVETEDKSGKFSAKTKIGWGPISVSASISGSVASHKENTRSSDNSAKYHVQVHAAQAGTPEGLSRVLDIIGEAVAPKAISNETAKPDSDLEKAMKYVIEKGKEVDLAEVKLQTAQMALAKDPSKQADVDNAQSGLTDAQDALTKANMAMQLVRKGQTYADAQTAAGI
ncbi:hypothetical protein VIH_003022 [Vibrio cholerae CT 5369-93]|nr:hypothetical protein VIH_003022 [Vibrio cholerae CT 5369-93]GIB54072.1 hypothetical protein VCSRO187_3672 [Vibrio cholerae]